MGSFTTTGNMLPASSLGGLQYQNKSQLPEHGAELDQAVFFLTLSTVLLAISIPTRICNLFRLIVNDSSIEMCKPGKVKQELCVLILGETDEERKDANPEVTVEKDESLAQVMQEWLILFSRNRCIDSSQ